MISLRMFRGLWAILAVMVAGCVQPPKQLYMWETFPRQQYDALRRDGFSAAQQMEAMTAHAEKARTAGAALPPGFRAHLGMLHLSLGNAEQARQLWQAEKSAFPESSTYIDQLLRRLESRAPQNENPV